MSVVTIKRNSRLSRSDRIFNTVNTVFWIVILLVILYPLYLVVIASISSPEAVTKGLVTLYPVDISTIGYEAILRNKELLRGYANSIVYTVSGTALSIIATITAAYALSRPAFPGKGLVNFMLVFTMFFSGGLIPSFLIMRDIGLYNNPLMLVVSGCVSVWNLMVARTFIQSSIPNELYEAAQLDGATHFQYFFRVVLPLCGTIIAVLCVYYGVGKWNDYFTGMIYLRDRSYLPLQTILKEIIATLQINMDDYLAGGNMVDMSKAVRTAQVVKYCAIVISTVPMITLYLFMQKYFVKGVMIGSIKG